MQLRAPGRSRTAFHGREPHCRRKPGPAHPLERRGDRHGLFNDLLSEFRFDGVWLCLGGLRPAASKRAAFLAVRGGAGRDDDLGKLVWHSGGRLEKRIAQSLCVRCRQRVVDEVRARHRSQRRKTDPAPLSGPPPWICGGEFPVSARTDRLFLAIRGRGDRLYVRSSAELPRGSKTPRQRDRSS